MTRHSTGITIVLTVALAVALSFAPLPEAWRPLPGLAGDKPAETLIAAILRAPKKKPVDAITGAPGSLAQTGANALPSDDVGEAETEMDFEAYVAEAADVGPLPPAATLGASEARAVRRLERLARKIGAEHVDLEQACLRKAADGTCEEHSLDKFFAKVEALQRGELQEPVRIVHLGDSQIASDHISDVIRHRLQLRYGSGGPGFLFVDRPTKFAGRKVRTGEATDGWEIVKLTDKSRPGLLGFSGVRFTAKDRQKTEFRIGRARYAELAFVTQPQGGEVEVRADSTQVSKLLTRFLDTELAFTKVQLPEGADRLSLTATGGEVSLFGVSLETGEPGIIYDSVGLPGALFEVYLRAPAKVFSAQLAQRDPSLVVIMLGGNEAYEIGRGWQDLDDARRHATQFLARVQKTVPDAACVMISPMDAGRRTVSGDIEPRPHTEEVKAMVRELALANGCAFWDLHRAMGGKGAVSKWLAAKVFNQDLVHPLPKGADLIGHLFDFAMERARTSRTAATNPRFVELPGLVDAASSALTKTFARFDALKQDAETERFTVVQLGASHTASHMFTDVVRAELAKSFGAAGRGYVAAGRPSMRLEAGKVKRELTGQWLIPDARERGPGEQWSLTGTRAEGQPGASMAITFSGDQGDANAQAVASVHYLEFPGMGRMSIRIDGAEVAVIGTERGAATRTETSRQGRSPGPLPRPGASAGAAPRLVAQVNPLNAVLGANPEQEPLSVRGTARVATFKVTGTSHKIEVHNLGPGPIAVFGVALEQERDGVVYDALGLPGSTSMLAATYDEDTFVEQLRTRGANLYVLFFGTNESALGELDVDEVRDANRTLLERMREASPDAECLIIGPTDRLERSAEGTWVESPSVDKVLRTLREAAAEEGCAFWSSRAAMGGPRAMQRWQTLDPELGHPDGIHLTREGYEALAHAFADDLLAAWRASKARAEGSR